MLQLEGDTYLINGESSEFANRQKNIFAKLDAVKVKPSKRFKRLKDVIFKPVETDPVGTDESKRSAKVSKKLITKRLKGKESIFKTPFVPPARFKQKVPDFQRNPHKWTRYTLSDVTQDDMSDQSNTAAAMAFLKEVGARKDIEEEPMEVDHKITFKKPVKTPSEGVVQMSSEDSPGEDGTSYFRGSKYIMPEYVIGGKAKTGKKVTTVPQEETTKDKQIKLTHLTDFDDDEDSE